MTSVPTEKGKTMANYNSCQHYDVCEYRIGVGSCPNGCVQYRQKDEYTIVRCKDCVYSKDNGDCCWCTFWGIDPDWEHFCSEGERKEE